MLFEILICLLAGLGAGVGTGFAGMSAAAIIGPLLMTFLGVPPYQAIGIGLLSDVLASLVSAYTYKKNDNLDIKNSLPLLLSVLVMTIVASFVSSLLPEQAMGGVAQFALIAVGIKFLIKPSRTTKEDMKTTSNSKHLLKSVIGGVIVGFICGFTGAGGGMMLLFVLSTFLGYELHMAVGTSVFIMAFTALTGGVSHIIIGGMPNIFYLILCVLFTLIFARIASVIANKASSKTLSRIAGALMIVVSVVVLLFNYVF